MQQSSILSIAQIRYFYRFTVNSHFTSAAFFAPIISFCIRYPAVPVCKNVQSQNQPLKIGIGFLCKAGKMAGFEPETVAEILPVQTKHQMYINNYDSWQGFGQASKHTLSHHVLCIAKATSHQICESSLMWGGFYFIDSLQQTPCFYIGHEDNAPIAFRMLLGQTAAHIRAISCTHDFAVVFLDYLSHSLWASFITFSALPMA